MVRPPKPPLPLQPRPKLTLEQRVWRYCEQEAVKEIECLMRGEVYQWRPYTDHTLRSLGLTVKP